MKPDTLMAEYSAINPALEKLRRWCAENYRQETIQVQCPFCSHQIPEKWQSLKTVTESDGRALREPYDWVSSMLPEEPRFRYVYIQWMECHNDACHEVIVQVTRIRASRGLAETMVFGWKSEYTQMGLGRAEKWIAVPKKVIPAVNAIVPAGYAKDYREAWTILDDSHRMSAVLSRKILADLLAEFAKLDDYLLEKAVEKFIEDPVHPPRLRENMDYLRVIANLSAHTKENKVVPGGIVEATREEVEWTLKIVSDLFDYFIIDPAKDKEMRDRINTKLSEAGRTGMLPKNPPKP